MQIGISQLRCENSTGLQQMRNENTAFKTATEEAVTQLAKATTAAQQVQTASLTEFQGALGGFMREQGRMFNEAIEARAGVSGRAAVVNREVRKLESAAGMSPDAKKFTPQRMEVEDAPGVSRMGDLAGIDTLWCALEAAVLKMGGGVCGVLAAVASGSARCRRSVDGNVRAA